MEPTFRQTALELPAPVTPLQRVQKPICYKELQRGQGPQKDSVLYFVLPNLAGTPAGQEEDIQVTPSQWPAPSNLQAL